MAKIINNVRPCNGIPVCEKHGTIYLEKVNIKNHQAIIGYRVPCKCEEYKKKKEKE
jgi:hypothetical protein